MDNPHYLAMVLHIHHLCFEHGYSASAISRQLGINLDEIETIIAKEKQARRG
jgi:hypothetical protein